MTTRAAAPSTPDVRWTAFDAVGLAHAFPATRVRTAGGARALCGSPWLGEQYTWPTIERCGACRQLLGVAV